MTQIPPKSSIFLYGGIASSFATIFSNPLDCIKIRMQIQGEPTSPKIYRHSFDAFLKIPREEGILALQKGLQPAMFRQFFYGALRFGIYSTMKSQDVIAIKSNPYLSHAFYSFFSGYTAALICTPLDLLKVRLQGHQRWGEKYKYHLFHNIAEIYRVDRLKGMFIGWMPTATRGGLVAMAEFSSYDHVKKYLLTHTSVEEGLWTHLLVGAISGCFGAFISNPIDVLKSRVMNQVVTPHKEKLYSGTIDCLVKTVKSEGIMSLYKGLVATSLRNIPQVSITFIVLEWLVQDRAKL